MERWFRVRGKNAKGNSEWSEEGHFVLRRLSVAEQEESKKRGKRSKRKTRRITMIKAAAINQLTSNLGKGGSNSKLKQMMGKGKLKKKFSMKKKK